MKKIAIFSLFLLLLTACNTMSTEEKIQNLNGYWGIYKAETAEGEIKIYKYNPSLDYIEIHEKKGYRMKVNPQLDGTFLVSNDKEQIKVEVKNDTIFLHYTTKMDRWTEQLVLSEEGKIAFKNEYGNVYTYKRFTGINHQSHGGERGK